MPDGVEMPGISTMNLWLLHVVPKVSERSSSRWSDQRNNPVLGCFWVELNEKIWGRLSICSKTALIVWVYRRCCQIRLFQALSWPSLEKSSTRIVLKALLSSRGCGCECSRHPSRDGCV